MSHLPYLIAAATFTAASLLSNRGDCAVSQSVTYSPPHRLRPAVDEALS
jgi:hypothetical protein